MTKDSLKNLFKTWISRNVGMVKTPQIFDDKSGMRNLETYGCSCCSKSVDMPSIGMDECLDTFTDDDQKEVVMMVILHNMRIAGITPQDLVKFSDYVGVLL